MSPLRRSQLRKGTTELYVAEEILAVIEQDMPSEPADTQQLRFRTARSPG